MILSNVARTNSSRILITAFLADWPWLLNCETGLPVTTICCLQGCDTGCEPFLRGWLCMIDQPLQWRGVQPTLLVYGGNCLALPVWVVMHPVRSSLVMFSSSEACSHWLNKVAQITTAKCFQYCFVIVRSDEVEVGYCSACAILLTCHTLLLNTRIPLQFNTQWWMTTVDEDLSQPGASYPSFTGWQAYAAHELLK